MNKNETASSERTDGRIKLRIKFAGTPYIPINVKMILKVGLGEKDSAREKSSLMCPKCGSMNTKIIDLTVLVPVLKCSDCGREWMPSPEGIGAGLSGAHSRDFKSRGYHSEVKPVQNTMGVFRTTLLLLIMIAIILGVVIIVIGLP